MSDRVICPQCGHGNSKHRVTCKKCQVNLNTTSEEVIYYSDKRVEITNMRAVLRGKSYPLGDITSAAMGQKPANRVPGIGFASAGLLMLLVALGGGDWGIAFFALLVMGLGFALVIKAKPQYVVKISRGSKEYETLSCNSFEYAEKVIEQINEAIKQPIIKESIPEPSDEAFALYNQGIELVQNANSNDSRAYRDAVSLLLLATEKAGAPFPTAHTALATIYYYKLGDSNSASKHATTALQQNANEFNAQLIKVYIASEKLKIMAVGASDLVRSGCASWPMFVVTVFSTLFAGGRVTMSQRNFKAEVKKLVQIFRRLCATELDAGQFSSMAEELLEIADLLADAKLKMGGQMPNIYRQIANVPLDNLFYEDDTQRREVTRIRQLAQGRAAR